MGIQAVSLEGLRPVTGYDGYFVSAVGDVFCTRPINGKGSAIAPLRPVKLCKGTNGYLQFGADKKKIRVHRAVAEAFLGPCPEGCEVAHKDGNQANNSASNLEYVHHSANEKMKRLHGTAPIGSKNGASKLTQPQVDDIVTRVRNGKRGTARKVAQEYGISESLVSMLVSGKRWRG